MCLASLNLFPYLLYHADLPMRNIRICATTLKWKGISRVHVTDNRVCDRLK